MALNPYRNDPPLRHGESYIGGSESKRNTRWSEPLPPVHAQSYIDCAGNKWTACPDCVAEEYCEIGKRVLRGDDKGYGCSAGVPKPGVTPKKLKVGEYI